MDKIIKDFLAEQKEVVSDADYNEMEAWYRLYKEGKINATMCLGWMHWHYKREVAKWL